MNTTENATWFVPDQGIMEMPTRLDSSNAETFAEDAVLCITSGTTNMVLDAARLSSISGAGMRALLTVAKAMHDRGGHLSIRNMKPQVKQFFDMTRYDCVITDEDTRPVLSLARAA